MINKLFLWALKIVILAAYEHHTGTSKLNSFQNRFCKTRWFIIPFKCITIIHILALSLVPKRAKQNEAKRGTIIRQVYISVCTFNDYIFSLYTFILKIAVCTINDIIFSANVLLYSILIFHSLNIGWLYEPSQFRI